MVNSTPLEHPGSDEIYESILVVEDEDEVRKVICLTLELQGYRVLAAATAEQALAVLKVCADPIHLMIVDVVLPSLDGPSLARQAVRFQPEMQVMYISGYSEESLAEHGISSMHPAFLAKPFSSATLGRKIRQLMPRPTS